jgi:hypothetical protein
MSTETLEKAKAWVRQNQKSSLESWLIHQEHYYGRFFEMKANNPKFCNEHPHPLNINS